MRERKQSTGTKGKTETKENGLKEETEARRLVLLELRALR